MIATNLEMNATIHDFANAREDIHAVLLTGSRNNPNVTADAYQDYDLVVFADSPENYLEDSRWMDTF